MALLMPDGYPGRRLAARFRRHRAPPTCTAEDWPVAVHRPHRAGTAPRVRRLDLPVNGEGCRMGSVVKKRRKRMAKKKHRKLLRKTRVQRRRLGK